MNSGPPDESDYRECNDVLQELRTDACEMDDHPWLAEDTQTPFVLHPPDSQPEDDPDDDDDDNLPVCHGRGERIILHLEDDDFEWTDYSEHFIFLGYSVVRCAEARELEKAAGLFRSRIVAVILDIRVMPDAIFTSEMTYGGRRTGIVAGENLLGHLNDAIFVGLSRSEHPSDEAWFSKRDNDERIFIYSHKRSNPPKQFAHRLHRIILRQFETQSNRMKASNLRSFIVHGHDHGALLGLKDYLQNVLHLPEPIVLMQMPTSGLSIIEKFEKHVANVDVVFILMTEDDNPGDSESNKKRARQNVIFELGYFVGKLGRKSGRIILLRKGNVEIPSDLSGVLTISIDHGIRAAGEEIRNELEALGNSLD